MHFAYLVYCVALQTSLSVRFQFFVDVLFLVIS